MISYFVINQLFRIWNSTKKHMNGKHDNKKNWCKNEKKTLKFDFIFCNKPTFSNIKCNSTILKIWKMWKYLRILIIFCFWSLFTRGKNTLDFMVYTCFFRLFFICKKSSITLRNQKKHKKVFLSREFDHKKNARLYRKKVPSFYG